MEALAYLKEYSPRADTFLNKFFDGKLMELDTCDNSDIKVSIQRQMIQSYKDYVQGGKKLRGALVQLGHDCSNGDRVKILPPSAGIEIIHSYLLIHDDIMDQDDIRRGRPSAHREYESWCRQHLGHSDPSHFGSSMAITLGDLGSIWGTELILTSDFPSERKIAALGLLGQILERTIYGQALDLSQQPNGREDDILRIHLYKTAAYTFSGPLQLGGILGNLETKSLRAMQTYGESVGVAFQLRDDELGLFGDEKILGKPIGSDVREGKNTLLRI